MPSRSAELLSRIEQVEADLKTRGIAASARDWCIKAGVSSTYLGTLKTRLRKRVTDRGDPEQLAKLAAVAGLPPDAFVFLERHAAPPSAATEGDPYPMRQVVAEMARAKGRDDSAIRGMLVYKLKVDAESGDPGTPGFWWDVLDHLEEAAEQADKKRKVRVDKAFTDKAKI